VRPHAGDKLPDPDQWQYSAESVVWRGASVRHGLLVTVQSGRAFVLAPLRELALPEGMTEIVLAAVAAALACSVAPQSIRRGLETWRSRFDRLELCGERHGVQVWIDHACTDEAALEQALDAFERKVTLVVGGPSFRSPVDLDLVRTRTNRVLMLPGTPMSTLRLWEAALQASPTSDLREALHLGIERTSVGGALLVAPGCVQGQELVLKLGEAMKA
jgi:UDP-N-acetylmuramoylalanine-D-glutamate ligase